MINYGRYNRYSPHRNNKAGLEKVDATILPKSSQQILFFLPLSDNSLLKLVVTSFRTTILEATQGKITNTGLEFELFFKKLFFTEYIKPSKTKIEKIG